MDLQLNGRVALVTGSSSGIGEGIVRALAREGAAVIVHGRDRDRAERVAAAVRAEGGTADVAVGDLTDEAEVRNLIEAARSSAGEIEILVNNAGGSAGRSDWADTDAAHWAETFDRNVLTALRMTTALLPRMRAAKWGRIVNISSLAGLMPPTVNPDYAAAKAGMTAMTASLAKAVATEGVTVNTVSPGTIHSDKLDRAFRQAAESRGVSKGAPWSEVEAAVLPVFAQVPMGRVGRVEEIADAVTFLCSPRASYITGSNIRLDGGLLPTT